MESVHSRSHLILDQMYSDSYDSSLYVPVWRMAKLMSVKCHGKCSEVIRGLSLCHPSARSTRSTYAGMSNMGFENYIIFSRL